MLSEVIPSDSLNDKNYKRYVPPSTSEVSELIENNREKNDREVFIEEHKDDPESAAKKRADEILAIAQEKYKSLELEANTLKIKVENEIRQQLLNEFEGKLQEAVKDVSGNYFDSIKRLNILKKKIYDNSEQELLKLVFQITEKVIGNEIKSNPEIVIEMLRKGFERVRNSDQYEIRVHPADFEMISNNKDRLEDIIKSGSEIRFIKSDKIERGGCIIKTGIGEVITEPSKQLDTIKKDILGG